MTITYIRTSGKFSETGSFWTENTLGLLRFWHTIQEAMLKEG